MCPVTFGKARFSEKSGAQLFMSYININISWLRRGIYVSLVRFLSLPYFVLYLGKDFNSGSRPVNWCMGLIHVKLFCSAGALKEDDVAMLCLILTLLQIPLVAVAWDMEPLGDDGESCC